MKKVFVISLMAVMQVVCMLNAQEYFTIGTKWVNYSQWYSSPPFLVEETREVKGETEINGRTYKVVKGTPVNVDEAGLHMSFGSSLWLVDGKKIYGMGMGRSEENLILMYDFSLEEGDVIDSYKYAPSTVVKTDSVVLANGQKAKRIFYDNRAADIEYVGSVNGFVFPIKQPDEENSEPEVVPVSFMGRWFCYCAIGDEVIYKTSEQICEEDVVNALDEVPADELLTIKDNVLSLQSVANGEASVYTPDGKRVMTISGNAADISTLPRGLYILRTATHSAKFVR